MKNKVNCWKPKDSLTREYGNQQPSSEVQGRFRDYPEREYFSIANRAGSALHPRF